LEREDKGRWSNTVPEACLRVGDVCALGIGHLLECEPDPDASVTASIATALRVVSVAVESLPARRNAAVGHTQRVD
jgi:hypothetical protein